MLTATNDCQLLRRLRYHVSRLCEGPAICVCRLSLTPVPVLLSEAQVSLVSPCSLPGVETWPGRMLATKLAFSQLGVRLGTHEGQYTHKCAHSHTHCHSTYTLTIHSHPLTQIHIHTPTHTWSNTCKHTNTYTHTPPHTLTPPHTSWAPLPQPHPTQQCHLSLTWFFVTSHKLEFIHPFSTCLSSDPHTHHQGCSRGACGPGTSASGLLDLPWSSGAPGQAQEPGPLPWAWPQRLRPAGLGPPVRHLASAGNISPWFSQPTAKSGQTYGLSGPQTPPPPLPG